MRPQSFFRLAVASCLLFATDAFLYAQFRIATQTHVRSQDVDASRLDELIAQNRYLELQRDLSAAELSSSDRTYFEGIVADRTHNFADAIALLGKAVPDLKAHSAHRAAWALRALASDYFEAGRYEDSANAYAALLKNYRGQFHAEDLQEFSDNLHTYEMLRGAPAQVVAAATGFTVATRLDPLGNTDVPVSVGKTGRLNGLCERFRVLKSGGRMLFSDALVVGEMISHEEINTRSWLLLLQSAGENERLSEHAGFREVRATDTTESAASIAKKWHQTRKKRRDELVVLEGTSNFEGAASVPFLRSLSDSRASLVEIPVRGG